MKALQSVGQIIGEVLKQLDDDRCKISISFDSFTSLLGVFKLLSRLRLDHVMLLDVVRSWTSLNSFKDAV